MRQLIALAMPPGPRFVEQVERAWNANDAVMPLDHRMNHLEQTELLERFGASCVVDSQLNVHKLTWGKAVQDDDALVMPTSGTTGHAKAAILTHHALAASAKITSDALEVTDSDQWLACLPVSHIGGFSVISRALITGLPLTVHSQFDPTDVGKAAANGATLTSLVNAALRQIDPYDFRKVLLGGGPAPEDIPANAIVTYGMTETGSGIVYDSKALPSVYLRTDRNNRLWVHSPTLLRAYRNVDESPLDENGWFCTNDEATVAYDGRLTIHGRADFVILSGGEKIWPDSLERVVSLHPAVGSVLARGEADPEWGERAVLDIVLAPGSAAPSLEELREFVKEHLPRYYAPRALNIVPSLPRTASGKLKRR